MKISTKGRYSLRVIIDLAEHRGSGYIPMKEVAARQNISLKYIEKLMPMLTKNGLVEGIHGKGGGYKLSRDPEFLTVGEILRLAEGDLVPVSCLEDGAPPCELACECRTLSMWKEFYDITNRFFDGITVADLMKNRPAENYVI